MELSVEAQSVSQGITPPKHLTHDLVIYWEVLRSRWYESWVELISHCDAFVESHIQKETFMEKFKYPQTQVDFSISILLRWRTSLVC